jgi:hypothetical protein
VLPSDADELHRDTAGRSPAQYATGNAYDFSKDLSTIVYARPGGH